MDSGRLVPDELTIGMLLDRIEQARRRRAAFMLDGFPRTTAQAEALDAALAEAGQAIDQALYIKWTREELVRRLAGRWSCPNCGAVYHEVNQPPKTAGVCDNCGAPLTQRDDDKPEAVRTRLECSIEEPRAAARRTTGARAS